MKILNLYAGLGGNRKLWGEEHQITAVEIFPSIAAVYKKQYPRDQIIIGDAIKYLRKYYAAYDLICASPPCHSHSRMNGKNHKEKFPDLDIYSMILFLNRYYKGKYCIENVIPWYKPLIEPSVKLGRHYFWSNFPIPFKEFDKYDKRQIQEIKIKGLADRRGISMDLVQEVKDKSWDRNHSQRQTCLRNMLDPLIGEYILGCVSI